ncbi:MAG: hypothetical protein WAU86_17635 [Oricola sp.]
MNSLGINRREFLITGVATGLAGCTATPRMPGDVDRSLHDRLEDLNKQPFFTLDLFRPEDGFSATVEVYGFRIHTGLFSGIRLTSKSLDAEDSSRVLVFRLPPQHNAETALPRPEVDDAFSGTSNPNAIDILLKKVGYLSSKEARLVFHVPLDKDALPIRGQAMHLSLEALLNWKSFKYIPEGPSVADAREDPDGAAGFDRRGFLLGQEAWKGSGADQVSAIDLPTGFYLQPSYGEAFVWRMQPNPARSGEYTEIWSAFIEPERGTDVRFSLIDIWGVAGGEPNGGTTYTYKSVTKNYPNDGGGESQEERDRYQSTTLRFDQRFELALTLSPRFARSSAEGLTFSYPSGGISGEACYNGAGHRIMVSTYGISADGGFLDFRGNWQALPGCAIKGWEQKTTRGRDTYVKVRYAGFLYPFGFKAELIEETERSYVRDSNGRLVAPLIKDTYIRPIDPTLLPQATLEECFSWVEILTPRTPSLDKRDLPDSSFEYSNLAAFCPHFDGEPFEFEFLGVDKDGNEIKWSMPVYFVSNRGTDANDFDRFPEDPNGCEPANRFGDEEKNYIAFKNDEPCRTPGGKVQNILRLIDRYWREQAHRFADYGGQVIALARANQAGQTSVEVKWLEWVRSVRPAPPDTFMIANGVTSVIRPMTPRVRTGRFAIPSLRTFSGSVPDMIGSYRDMRVQFMSGNPQPIKWRLDPEVADDDIARYMAGRLDPDADGNRAESYFCALPTRKTGNDSDIANADGIATAYFPELNQTPEILKKFEGLKNFVSFGTSKTTESLGGLATPDGDIAILTRRFGPSTDNRQNIRDYSEQTSVAVLSKLAPLTALDGHSSGLLNLGVGAIFGDKAEIIPGIKFTDVLSYVLQVGGDGVGVLSTPVVLSPYAKSMPETNENGLQWDLQFKGIEWFETLVDIAPYVDINEILTNLIVVSEPTEPLESTPIGIEASLNWSTEDFVEFDASIFKFENRSETTGRNSRFEVSASAFIDVVQPRPTISAKCTLHSFSLEFLQALIVDFRYVSFEMKADGSKTFDPSIGTVGFAGVLSFIDGLQSLLKGLEDEFGLKISISPQRVMVSQVIAFPPGGTGQIFLGPAVISNLSFQWGVIIPILGRERTTVQVGLASREDPMTIAVGIYGGRAYAIFQADTSGPKLIEVSSDYGGVFEANFGGIAKGSVSLTAGFAFSIKFPATGAVVDFLAYAQFTGKLSILSLISVCSNVVVGMGFVADSGGRVIYGKALCTVSFKIVLKTFEVRYETIKRDEAGNRPAEAAAETVPSGVMALSFEETSGAACSDIYSVATPFDPFAQRKGDWERFFNASV